MNGAATLALADLGILSPGKLPDIVVLDADLLADVALSRASVVLKEGHQFFTAELMSVVRFAAANY